MFDIVFVSHIPVFYKVNLYNEIAKSKNIFVIFISSGSISKRGDDFISLENAKFQFFVISTAPFEIRDKMVSLVSLYRKLKQIEFKQIVVSGWDLFEFWLIVFTNFKSKNALALESTIYESKTLGLTGLVKRIFLNRVVKVYASGQLHKSLLKSLKYTGQIVITNGVGIIRKPNILNFEHTLFIQNRMVYVGRLSIEKNLEGLINLVNKFPHIILDIYGVGPLDEFLRIKANKINIVFHGSVRNSELPGIFAKADFLVLPSISEPWGLVVEEALYFGLPVIVSDHCGVSELVIDNNNGYVFPLVNFYDHLKIILLNYEKKCITIIPKSKCFINDKDLTQVNAYL